MWSSSKIAVAFLDIGKAGSVTSNIRVNYEKGIHQAVEHLFGLGHRQIAFISGSNQFKSAQIRRKAFLSAMEKHQPSLHTEPVIYEGDFQFESGGTPLKELLPREHPPTPT